ncbi:hypothetical protein C8239_13435 [Paracidovorax avenae]|uniref:hypothetical protein n=1 Tax=Paracidovorax avenae TaxID=80867 RepID=UPI000D1760AA|nr:hypothetical protein [Paracidovorax avenae]AVS85631.1 hypothetical protein C8239_13435 [Paracidovorax avenae]AVS89146.1 hypothetical protein C8238_13660 [Paracidovorax avenae]AVT03371.1 hypothetical protein C8243_13350 [Paracidovorax avenae]
MMATERRHRSPFRTGTLFFLAFSLAIACGEAPAKPKASSKPRAAAKARKAAKPRTPAPAAASQGDPLSSRVGVVDANTLGAVRLALASDTMAVPSGGLHYLPLAPAAKASECCVRPQAAVPPRDVAILRFDGDNSQLAAEHTAQFTQAPGEPFMGLALLGKATVTRASDQRLFLQWPDRKVSVRVDHCVSGEAMHVRVADSAGPGQWQPAAYYYLPLAVPAQPDCPVDEAP